MSWEKVKQCTVAIKDSEESIYGTGFFISSDGHLLTCAHVVEEAGGCEQVRVHGQSVHLVYSGERDLDDFTILQVLEYQGECVPLSLTFEPMTRFLSIGYGRNDFPEGASIEGQITDQNIHADFGDRPMLRLRIEADAQMIQGGYSGSPVFDAEREVVVGAIAASDRQEGALAIPLTTIQERWPTLKELLDSLEEPQLSREFRGPLSRTSELYVERPPIEQDCYEEILQPGALIRIKAPRQMGKSSLMVRVLHHAEKQGCQTILINFKRAGRSLANLDVFLRWFCQTVGQKLKQLNKLEQYWSFETSQDKCSYYFEECLLENSLSPIVLGLDEVDEIFEYTQVADDFFALLRSWHEASRYEDTSSKLWKNLRLVMVYSIDENYTSLNINQSPFNVGTSIKLIDFDKAQIQDLSHRYGLNKSKHQVEIIIELLGGHPYLTQLAFYHLQRKFITLDDIQARTSKLIEIYKEHLDQLRQTLQKDPDLYRVFHKIIQSDGLVKVHENENLFSKLQSIGLVKIQENKVIPSCELYKLYFLHHLRR